MKSTNKKGFTLIELLVVIAIIGLMSSVVLASLNTARSKAANTTIKSGLVQLRSQATIYYNNNTINPFQYSNTTVIPGVTCGTPALTVSGLFSDSVIQSMVNKVVASSGSASSYCSVDSQTYVVVIPLKSAEGSITHWCVDSAGASKGLTSLPTTGVLCP